MPERRSAASRSVRNGRSGRFPDRFFGPVRGRCLVADAVRCGNMGRRSDRFFGQKLARRTTQKFGDLVDVDYVVFCVILRTFDLTDKTARNADPKGQHGLRYFLSPSFASNGVDYV